MRRFGRKIRLVGILASAILLSACSDDVNFNIKGELPSNGAAVDRDFKNEAPFSYSESEDSSSDILMLSNIPNNAHLSVKGEHIYFLTASSIYRLNPESGNITYLCSDPLCRHASPACPFFGIDTGYGFYLEDSRVYYRQRYTYRYEDPDGNTVEEKANRISQYDLRTQELKIMRNINSPAIAPNMVFSGEWCYFTDVIYDEEERSAEYALCRQNTESLKLEVLYSEEIWRYNPLIAYGDTLLVYDNLTSELISHDTSGKHEEKTVAKNVSLLFKCSDHFIYRKSDGQVVKSDLDGGNVEKLLDGVEYLYVTDKYIYYTENDLRMIGESKDGTKISINASPIMRVDHSGENNETVYTPAYSEDFFLVLPYFTVEGRYLYSAYDWYEKKDGVLSGESSKSEGNYLRYDTVTGEIYYFDFD